MLVKDPNSRSAERDLAKPSVPRQRPTAEASPLSVAASAETFERGPLRVRDLVSASGIAERPPLDSPGSRLGVALMRIGGWKPSAPEIIARLEAQVRTQAERAAVAEEQLRATTAALQRVRTELAAQRAACVAHNCEREHARARLQRGVAGLEAAQKSLVEQITLLEARLSPRAGEAVGDRTLSTNPQPSHGQPEPMRLIASPSPPPFRRGTL